MGRERVLVKLLELKVYTQGFGLGKDVADLNSNSIRQIEVRGKKIVYDKKNLSFFLFLVPSVAVLPRERPKLRCL